MSTAAETAAQVETLLDLQLEFTAAEAAMNQAWVIYRNDRSNATALEAYTESLRVCQQLKSRIFLFRVAGRSV